MKAKNKIVAYFIKHKLFFCLLICLPLYHFLIVNGTKPFSVTDFTYPYFAVDFSMGFCDKFFIGELFHLLVGKYTFEAATTFVSVFYALFILLISFLLERFFLAFEQNKKACLVIICFALIGPFSFNIFAKQFGMLDFFWALLFFFALAFLNHKYLRFLVPVISLMMVFVHNGAVICYIPALLLIIAFYFIKSDSKKERISFIVIFILSVVISFCFALYFLKNDADNLVYSIDRFRSIVQDERGAYSAYFDMTYYKEIPNIVNGSYLYKKAYEMGFMGGDAMSFNGVFESVRYRIQTTIISGSLKQIIICVIVSIIPWSFLIYLFKGYFKNDKFFLKKGLFLVYILLSVFIQLIGCFLSTDTPRWFANSFILLFTFTLLVLYFDYREGLERVEKLFSKVGYSFVYVFLFIYSSVVFDPYPFVFF